MHDTNNVFRLPVPRSLSAARSLTQREALLLREHGFGRTTRRWIVWRDDAGTVTLGRPAGNGWEMHRVYR